MHDSLAQNIAPAMRPPPPLNVLVVDDCAFDRARIRRYCQQSGLIVSFSEADGLRSMETALKEQDFDIFILDYLLPRGSGLAGVGMLRANDVLAKSGIVMVSGTGAPWIRQEALRSGCDDFLTKDALNAEVMRWTLIDVYLSRRDAPHLSARSQSAVGGCRPHGSITGVAQDAVSPTVPRPGRRGRKLPPRLN